jgi:phosphate transport system permease protein
MTVAGDGSGATTMQASPTAAAVQRALTGRRMDVVGVAFEGLLLLTLLIAIGILAHLLIDVFSRGIGVLVERGADFLSSPLSQRAQRAGVGQGIIGSILLMVIVAIVAFPLGVGAAIYLEEYARDTPVTRLINTVVRNLAGVPSIVYGLLGAAIFIGVLGGLTGGGSVISGGLTLAILVLPIVIITTAEALRAVPGSIREAGFGVGATRWEVVRSHVVPYAAPGILTGTILSLARAFGETAPLIVVGAVAGTFRFSADNLGEQLTGPYTALPTVVFQWARQPGDEFRLNTAAAIIVLLIVLLSVNALAIFLRNRFERKW